MFGTLRRNIATLIYNEAGTFDSEGNFTEGTEIQTEIKCSIQPRLENKRLTSSNLENQYSFSVYTDLLDVDTSLNFKISFYNKTFDVIRIEHFNLLNYSKIYVK